MLRGLTGAGLGAVNGADHIIELAAKHGFDAVDISAKDLVDRHGLEGARELLQEKNIKIGAIGLSVDWRTTEENFRAGLGKLAEEAAAAAALGCHSCTTYILPSVDGSAAHFMALATKRLRICAQILGAYGVRLGLEFVGPHHLRTNWENPFIWTLQETLDWIDAIDEPNVGLLFDAYHWYTNELTVADIEQLRPEQIVHVHINDAKDVPVSEVLDNDRVYPGEGVIDLVGFLQGLQSIGYKGVVSQEILSTTKPTDAPEALAARSQACFDKVFGAAGLSR